MSRAADVLYTTIPVGCSFTSVSLFSWESWECSVRNANESNWTISFSLSKKRRVKVKLWTTGFCLLAGWARILLEIGANWFQFGRVSTIYSIWRSRSVNFQGRIFSPIRNLSSLNTFLIESAFCTALDVLFRTVQWSCQIADNGVFISVYWFVNKIIFIIINWMVYLYLLTSTIYQFCIHLIVFFHSSSSLNWNLLCNHRIDCDLWLLVFLSSNNNISI